MPYHLLERFGVELEYMLVNQETLAIAPIADVLLMEAGADQDGDLRRGDFGWSNELTNHVVELKTALPVSSFEQLSSVLHGEVQWMQQQAARHGCALLPTAMHPWMDPAVETVLWPHGNAEIYQAYDRIFHCQGHGWANVQSTHLNLSFSGDEEFAQLHAAIRLVLPLIPALAASSPLVEGKLSGRHDSRLFFYRDNQSLVPAIAGSVIPEPLFTEVDYRQGIFQPIAAAMPKHDPDGILELDFLNSRGAIARFDRGSIEIRLMDIQECPAADIAILEVIVAALRWILESADLEEIQAVPTEVLAQLLWETAQEGENARVEVDALLKVCGFAEPVSAAQVWQIFADRVGESLTPSSLETLSELLEGGSLATRIQMAAGDTPSQVQLESIYRELGQCLVKNCPFRA